MTPDEARARAFSHKDLNAFISLTEEQGPGPAVAVKDLVDVRGTVTTAGSDLLPDVPCRLDAPVITEVRKRGCQIVGKTNLHEWAYGATSNNRHYGPVRNPRDRDRIAGGSSGGSAAAVAAGLCDWAIGTDTTGSITIPAALCGVVGIRPSLGLVSTEGILPVSKSMDTVGPIATDVLTAASALESMSGLYGLVPGHAAELGALKLAVPLGWVEGLDKDVTAVWERVSKGLLRAPFPNRRRLYSCATIITLVEGASFHWPLLANLADRYDGRILEDLREGVRLAGHHSAALAEKRHFEAEIDKAMHCLDAIVLPATSCIAPSIGDDDGTRERLNRFTRPLSLAGRPVITFPGPSESLPVGILLMGHRGEEAALLNTAFALHEEWRS